MSLRVAGPAGNGVVGRKPRVVEENAARRGTGIGDWIVGRRVIELLGGWFGIFFATGTLDRVLRPRFCAC